MLARVVKKVRTSALMYGTSLSPGRVGDCRPDCMGRKVRKGYVSELQEMVMR